MRFAPHYIETCAAVQPPCAESRHHTLSTVELGLIAELAAQDRLDLAGLSKLLGERDATGAARPSLVATLAGLPDLGALLARQGRFLQIEAEALFAALLVRERIASTEWIMRWLTERTPRSPWL